MNMNFQSSQEAHENLYNKCILHIWLTFFTFERETGSHKHKSPVIGKLYCISGSPTQQHPPPLIVLISINRKELRWLLHDLMPAFDFLAQRMYIYKIFGQLYANLQPLYPYPAKSRWIICSCEAVTTTKKVSGPRQIPREDVFLTLLSL